jgi:hypothetical protein
MAFDFDLFAGAVRSLSRALDQIAEVTGIPRGALTGALHRHAVICKNKWEARLWKSAHSEKELGKWIWRERKKFDADDETDVLNLADKIPTLVRRNLIEIAKTIPAPHGGKPPKLDLFQRWHARAQFKKLRRKGLSKANAYKTVAKRMSVRMRTNVSAHTVRRACDKRERGRAPKATELTDLE